MQNRRKFLKASGLAYLSLAVPHEPTSGSLSKPAPISSFTEENMSIIGQYGEWANRRRDGFIPTLSFRNRQFSDVTAWQKTVRKQVFDRMGFRPIKEKPTVTVIEKTEYDGLYIEKISWQLPYGRPTEAIVLKPANAKGKLPAIIALHDHGGNKYFGTRKIAKTADAQHPMMAEHQRLYYGDRAWANEMAKKGYVVLVPDAFTFGSRRVMLQDVPVSLRNNLTDDEPEKQTNIDAYNEWAGNHEHIMAKSLFSAGTTWPAVFLAEDRKALDILCDRSDVDANNIGCCGLSGGGLRSVYLGGLDSRIKCAVPVGFMTTWRDFSLNKSFTHTWMTYIPLLPNELDFPEILGLRIPLPTLVLNDKEDNLFTLSEMHRADAVLGEVYKKAKAADRYRCSFYDGPHKFDVPMQEEAFAWFDKWLK